MDFNLEELKNKYRKRPRADIVDLDRMQVMIPFLVREICRLESELGEAKEYISNLEKKTPADSKSGTHGGAEWDVAYDLKKNRLMVRLKGFFDYKSAKLASNAVVHILDNVKPHFDLIQDIRELEAITDLKILFHLRKLRYLLVQAGINRSVRIDREKETVVSTVFRKHFQDGLKAINVKTLEEADVALENEGKFLNL